jgi:ABC-type glutathione transport system ATPase component
VIPGSPQTGHCVGRPRPWQNAAVAQDVAPIASPGTESPRPAAIETRDLTKRFGERRAVDSLSIRVPRGIIAGLVGPNGAGKTTTLRMLLGWSWHTRGNAHRTA